MHYAKIFLPHSSRMSRPDASAVDARAGALSDLRRAVQALRPLCDQVEDRADLLLIEEAVGRLAQDRGAHVSGIADFDPARLATLLQITGPDLAAELLARLTEDLTTTQDTLTLAAQTADWKRLREGSHVLISLAGSVGAVSLQTMSESLNALAHAQDQPALAGLMPPLEAELAALIRLIRATRAPNGSAR